MLKGDTDENSVGSIWATLDNQGLNAYITADPADGGLPGNVGLVNPTQTGLLHAVGIGYNASNQVLANDGSGRLYDEIVYEASRVTKNITRYNLGYQLAIGLIGYSHGGGMIYNLSQKLLMDKVLKPKIQVVFAGTIDAVQYDPKENNAALTGWFNPNGLKTSPLTGWIGGGSLHVEGINYYENTGFLVAPKKLNFVGTGKLEAVHGYPLGQPIADQPPVGGESGSGMDHSKIAVNNAVLTGVKSAALGEFGKLV